MIIAIAGMEGALASVIGGLADCPVIAVPTSVGYGASFHGLSALLSMLNSCASGAAFYGWLTFKHSAGDSNCIKFPHKLICIRQQFKQRGCQHVPRCTHRLYDVGVAGMHRTLAHLDDIMSASVIIAIAGMEGV